MGAARLLDSVALQAGWGFAVSPALLGTRLALLLLSKLAACSLLSVGYSLFSPGFPLF